MAEETTITDAVIRFFKEDDWPFQQLDGQPLLQTATRGENGEWNCFAQAREVQAQLVFYSVCPVAAPAEKRTAMAEFLTRANYGMVIGNFEMDLDDGEVRYKTSIDTGGGPLTSVLIRPLVHTNVLVMDRYLPGIVAVIYDNVSPAEAVVQVESV